MTAVLGGARPEGSEETASRRSTKAVVTGLGVLAPNGASTEIYWAAVLAGVSGLRTVTRFDSSDYTASVAGEVNEDFAGVAGNVPGRLLPQTDHMTRLALLAADAAVDDAGLVPRELPTFAMGIVTAASAGGFEFGQKELEALWSKGSEHVSAYQSFAWFYPVNTGQISIRHDLRGPAGALVADEAGGLDAISKARRHIYAGTPYMITGGIDGSLCPWSWICLEKSGRISTEADAARAFLPFDTAASGSVPGEGGAILVLEDEATARERGAKLYGEIAGYGTAFDPAPGVAGRPGLLRAIENALADAGASAAQVDVVFADASGVPAQDAVEVEVLTAVFGARSVPVTAPKATTGRLAAGAGPLDVATALLAIRDHVIPPTANVTDVAYAGLDLVLSAPRPAPISVALVLARGQGGYNSAVVVRNVD